MKLGEERFNGLAAQVELVEEARVILIHNLAVEYGLMNGTQGIVKQIVFEPGHHPGHANPRLRMPSAIVVDFLKYAGNAFTTIPSAQLGCQFKHVSVTPTAARESRANNFR